MSTATLATPTLAAPVALAPYQPVVAARALNASKTYGKGDAVVRALDGVDVDVLRRPVHRHHGPVGLRQVDPDAHHRRPRHAHERRASSSATPTSATLNDKQLTQLRRDRIGFIFQAFNLVPTLTALENITLPMALAGRKPDQAWLDPSSTPSASASRLNHRPSRALRRPAAACRRRPGPGQPAGDHLRRRADRQPRLPHRRRDPVVHAPGRPRAWARRS